MTALLSTFPEPKDFANLDTRDAHNRFKSLLSRFADERAAYYRRNAFRFSADDWRNGTEHYAALARELTDDFAAMMQELINAANEQYGLPDDRFTNVREFWMEAVNEAISEAEDRASDEDE